MLEQHLPRSRSPWHVNLKKLQVNFDLLTKVHDCYNGTHGGRSAAS